MGEGVGVAAALAVRGDIPVREVLPQDIQKVILK
jgi:hypothetical protein